MTCHDEWLPKALFGVAFTTAAGYICAKLATSHS